MATPGARVILPARDLYGSRLRCLLFTHQPDAATARLLTELVHPHGVVDADRDRWTPRGLADSDEAKLGESDFLPEAHREALTAWWLATRQRANTPNWDIVSTCTIDGRRGLVLVEAKAHRAELGAAGKSAPTTANGVKNHEQIAAAIAEASRGLDTARPGFSLSVDTHYQLCNRFAWSWKLATLGVPVVLVYLGFLNAEDMADRGQERFDTASAWEAAVHDYASHIVPGSAWDQRLDIRGTAFYPLIRAVDLCWSVGVRAGEDRS